MVVNLLIKANVVKIKARLINTVVISSIVFLASISLMEFVVSKFTICAYENKTEPDTLLVKAIVTSLLSTWGVLLYGQV